MNISIPKAVEQKLRDARISPEEAKRTMLHCESTGQKILKENGLYLGHMRMDNITVWVEYRCHVGALELCGAYAHRMEVLP